MSNGKKALITGITGQDGSHLAEFLLEKGYKVYGLARRSSTFNTQRIDHLIETRAPHDFDWFRGDLQDTGTLLRVLRHVKPDELYHLGAQSHVQVSFDMPVYTFETVATGTLRLLETVRTLGLDCKIYNAASSEMYGDSPSPQSEDTPMRPRSPYAIGKLAAFNMASHYRDAYDMKIWNGILFNHEGPRRGKTFVTRKITRTIARMAHGVSSELRLGNIDSRRDWGFAPEYVEAMWRMLQTDEPDDYVIATGRNHSVRECVERAFEHVGVHIEWRGEGLDEVGVAARVDDSPYRQNFPFSEGDVVVRKDPRYFRPAEVDSLLGDASKARRKLQWEPKVSFESLIHVMMEHDLDSTDTILEGTRKKNEQWRDYVL